VGNAGKLSAMNENGISLISSLQRVPYALDRNMPHIFAEAADTGFLLFKEQVSFKYKNKISAVQCKRKTF
jgi:hypothetical protein